MVETTEQPAEAVRAAAPAPLPNSKTPARKGLFHRGKPTPAPLAALASATGTSALVLAALSAAYGWTEKTKMTRQEFLQRRDEWLKRPASEV